MLVLRVYNSLSLLWLLLYWNSPGEGTLWGCSRGDKIVRVFDAGHWLHVWGHALVFRAYHRQVKCWQFNRGSILYRLLSLIIGLELLMDFGLWGLAGKNGFCELQNELQKYNACTKKRPWVKTGAFPWRARGCKIGVLCCCSTTTEAKFGHASGSGLCHVHFQFSNWKVLGSTFDSHSRNFFFSFELSTTANRRRFFFYYVCNEFLRYLTRDRKDVWFSWKQNTRHLSFYAEISIMIQERKKQK